MAYQRIPNSCYFALVTVCHAICHFFVKTAIRYAERFQSKTFAAELSLKIGSNAD